MVTRLARRLRYEIHRQTRQALFTLLFPAYRRDLLRHSIPLGQLCANAMFQKVFRINGRVPWPVSYSSRVTYPEKVTAGSVAKRCIAINEGIYIQGMNGIDIGEGSWIGPGVKIVSANHSADDLQSHDVDRPISIGDNCWIGSNAVILPGVEIGDNVIVGAGAVVAGNVLPDLVVVGVPARAVRRR